MKDLFMERAAAMALGRAFGFEPRISNSLTDRMGSAAAVFALGQKGLEELFAPYGKLRGKLNIGMLEAAERELEDLQRKGIHYIARSESIYPERLRDCTDAPSGLYIRSCSAPEEVLKGDGIAVVGTRDISPYGNEWCERIVRSIAASGQRPSIISGLAIGVDVRAHLTALDCGLPTIAVLPTGIDDVYPRRHTGVAQRIASAPGCALVTDYPPGTPPIAINFIRRNRIIAGMSRSTILVESRMRGGGTMTARLAAGYGRELFCLPGRIDDPRSEGCNLLIRENLAGIIDSTQSLCMQLGFRQAKRAAPVPLDKRIRIMHEKDGAEGLLELCVELAMLVSRNRGITTEEASRTLGRPYGEVSAAAGLLESDGLLTIDLLQRCSICPKDC